MSAEKNSTAIGGKNHLGIKGPMGILDIPSSLCVFILPVKSNSVGSYGEDKISHPMKNEFYFFQEESCGLE